MSPGDRPDLPLAEEPLLGLRPPLTGTGALGGVQPASGPFALEEEPALWPSVSGPSPSALSPPSAGGRPARPSRPVPVATLAATGAGSGTAVGGLLLVLAAGLRLRLRRMSA